MGVAQNWFGKTSSGVSAHLIVDGRDTVECVKPGDRAWHCGPKGNPLGYGIEVTGFASQSAQDWTDGYSQAALRFACAFVLGTPVLAAIPRRFLTDDELRSGQAGHITHAQVARVLGGTTHSDPGPNFPVGLVTGLLGTGQPAPAPNSALPTLTYGLRNDPRVARLQSFLNSYGWKPALPLLPVTGSYLDQTREVVRQAQIQMGITGPDADGSIVGPRTNAAFQKRGY